MTGGLFTAIVSQRCTQYHFQKLSAALGSQVSQCICLVLFIYLQIGEFKVAPTSDSNNNDVWIVIILFFLEICLKFNSSNYILLMDISCLCVLPLSVSLTEDNGNSQLHI